MTDTVSLIHTEEGTGAPAFVLIHGITCDQTDWRPQLEALSQSTRVIAPTLRGHGGDPSPPASLSMENLAADVVALMHEKALTKVVVAGHSMGTRVAFEVASQAPDLVAGMILVDGSYLPCADLNASVERFNAATTDDKITSWLTHFVDAMFVDGTLDAFRRHCTARAHAMPHEALRSLYRGMLVWDTKCGATSMEKANVPMLVLQSTTRSEDGSRRVLKEGETGSYPETVKRFNADTEIAVLAGHGHFTGLEAPDWTNEVIVDWCRRHAFI